MQHCTAAEVALIVLTQLATQPYRLAADVLPVECREFEQLAVRPAVYARGATPRLEADHLLQNMSFGFEQSVFADAARHDATCFLFT